MAVAATVVGLQVAIVVAVVGVAVVAAVVMAAATVEADAGAATALLRVGVAMAGPAAARVGVESSDWEVGRAQSGRCSWREALIERSS